jgi:hypothetical protein
MLTLLNSDPDATLSASDARAVDGIWDVDLGRPSEQADQAEFCLTSKN